MKNKNRDFSKPFVEIYREGDWIILESNLPNNQIGDFAFEWDVDGSSSKRWKEHLEQLEKEGRLGDLVYRKLSMKWNEQFDSSNLNIYPFESYEFRIIDFQK